MALTGDIVITTYSTHPTLTSSVFVEYPSDLNEDSEHYDKRGTSETISVSQSQEVRTVYSGSYIRVKNANVYTLAQSGSTTFMGLEGHYRVYGSAESRSADWTNHLYEGEIIGHWDFSSNTDPYEAAYDWIKTTPYNSGLTDA